VPSKLLASCHSFLPIAPELAALPKQVAFPRNERSAIGRRSGGVSLYMFRDAMLFSQTPAALLTGERKAGHLAAPEYHRVYR
jgi:hypothetical protein